MKGNCELQAYLVPPFFAVVCGDTIIVRVEGNGVTWHGTTNDLPKAEILRYYDPEAFEELLVTVFGRSGHN